MVDGEDPGTFTGDAWTRIAGWREAVETMPFIRALADGSLPDDAFTYYLTQDAGYLVEFSRALSIASQLAPDRPAQAFFAGSAHDALEVESSLHRDWLADRPGSFVATPSPVTAAYVDHLLAIAARGSYPILVAAVLPCYWLYAHIGEVLLGQAGDLTGHRYAQWINTYADPEFQEATRRARTLANAAAVESGGAVYAAMLTAFERSSMHEYLFFAQGLSPAQWPTPPGPA